MPLKVIQHPEARRELKEAGRYYHEQSPGLADEFFDEVDAFVAKIIANPLSYSIRIADVRRANLKRFPYHLHYMLHGGAIAVVPVSHHRQRPYYWLERTRDRGWMSPD